MNDKELMQSHIQEANVPCDVVTDYKPTDGVCQTCSRRALCAIVAADVEPDQVIAALALLRRVETGDAVVIEKRDGQWPLIETDAKGMVSFLGTDYSTQWCAHIREAAAAWNKEGAK